MGRRCGGNRNLVLWAVLLLATLGHQSSGWGWSNTPIQGTFTVTFTEPTVQSNGITPLTSLTSCSVYVSINGASFTLVQTVPASSPSGGGVQTITPTIAWGPVPSQALPLTWEVKCTNSVGQGASPPDRVTTLDPYPLLIP